MQRWIESANRNREAIHRAKYADKIRALQGKQFLECGAAVFLGVGENHGSHVRQLRFTKEHMFGATETNALGAERARLDGIAWNIGVGPYAQLAEGLGPTHELHQLG